MTFKLENFHPDPDNLVRVTVGDTYVSVSRDEHGDVHVAVVSSEDQAEVVLGKEPA